MHLPKSILSLAGASAISLAAGAALAGPNGSTELRVTLKPGSPPACGNIAPFAAKPLIVAWGDYGAIVHSDGFYAYLAVAPPVPHSNRISAVYAGKQKHGDTELSLQIEIRTEGPELFISTVTPGCEWRDRAKLD